MSEPLPLRASGAPAEGSHLLITIAVPTCSKPISRHASKQELLGGATLRQLMDRSVSLRAPLAGDVSVAQLESEMTTVLAIGELLASGQSEILVKNPKGGPPRVAQLDEPAQRFAHEHIDAAGDVSWTLNLEVRARTDPLLSREADRRQPEPGPAAPVSTEAAPTEPATEESAPAEAKGYVRKTDLLRAQLLPEVEALDLSGLFVADFGPRKRRTQEMRNVVLSTPSRITDTLLQGNGYRRAGDHAKALACYRELVDADPKNADFRFLCGQMLKALGQEEQALEAFTLAKELGHEGARKEIESLTAAEPRARGLRDLLRLRNKG